MIAPDAFAELRTKLSSLAAGESRRLGQPVYGTGHLLLALLADPDDAPARALGRLGIGRDPIDALVRERGHGNELAPGLERAGQVTPAEQQTMQARLVAGGTPPDEAAWRAAAATRVVSTTQFLAVIHRAVEHDEGPGTASVLAALAEAEGTVGAEILRSLGVEPRDVLDALAAEWSEPP